MNTKDSLEKGTPRRTLAVGWFDNFDFQEICTPWVARLKEVFFPWPGIKSSRPEDEWTPERRARLIADLKWARANGLELDVIFNVTCYGDIAISMELANRVDTALKELSAENLLPEHLTTASPFIATVVRKNWPSIKIRLSINMDIAQPIALSYIDELYDGFYAGRNAHRRLDYVAHMAEWAHAHGKHIGLQANVGCLRDCPFHGFHNNLHGHNRMGQSAAGEAFGFSVFRCRTHYERGNYIDFLRAIWIRPEDLPRYEQYVDVVKLATRRHPNPAQVIAAYASYSFDGDLPAITDPCFTFPVKIDNKALGASPLWEEVRDCPHASDCQNCGKCAALFKAVAQPREGADGCLTKEFLNFFKG